MLPKEYSIGKLAWRAGNGDTLINCLAYIDLNPVRANLAEKPEAYRWSSIGYHVQRDNEDGFLSLDFGLAEFGHKNVNERLSYYRKFLYEKGTAGSPRPEVGDRKSHHRQRGKIDDNVVEVERERGFKLNEYDKFRYRTRYFIDSGIIGSREFVDPPALPKC